ncbi:hypothetical protein FHS99_003498 [Sphingomonas prati]|uniref:Uncharacterized protein n=2 Tax=Sphingomonas prati TaxID=1843237 RepID=A0A7W9BVY0_9SPHN|nr:hypothetical protein [Sphingomonas prati]MBB5730990.1 hypothetical protein [Sphingomonas prati]
MLEHVPKSSGMSLHAQSSGSSADRGGMRESCIWTVEAGFVLVCGQENAVDPDPNETNELISKLFYLMTVRLEDAAGAAAEGQGAHLDLGTRSALAERLRQTGQEVAIVAEAVSELLRHLT